MIVDPALRTWSRTASETGARKIDMKDIGDADEPPKQFT
jgi:hypothetical protein